MKREALAGFVAWGGKTLAGDEKGQAQIFLDRLLQAFGAHVTHPADIMKIIGPTIVEPWRRKARAGSRHSKERLPALSPDRRS
jgi:hypothetical protein